ncbi:MAG: hypothetical protein HYZ52_01015 [Candidatus Omnitrophica bacterium]|nr:hypothetical protein [Candidatus Omnitrophota bacterium]
MIKNRIKSILTALLLSLAFSNFSIAMAEEDSGSWYESVRQSESATVSEPDHRDNRAADTRQAVESVSKTDAVAGLARFEESAKVMNLQGEIAHQEAAVQQASVSTGAQVTILQPVGSPDRVAVTPSGAQLQGNYQRVGRQRVDG